MLKLVLACQLAPQCDDPSPGVVSTAPKVGRTGRCSAPRAGSQLPPAALRAGL